MLQARVDIRERPLQAAQAFRSPTVLAVPSHASSPRTERTFGTLGRDRDTMAAATGQPGDIYGRSDGAPSATTGRHR